MTMNGGSSVDTCPSRFDGSYAAIPDVKIGTA